MYSLSSAYFIRAILLPKIDIFASLGNEMAMINRKNETGASQDVAQGKIYRMSC